MAATLSTPASVMSGSRHPDPLRLASQTPPLVPKRQMSLVGDAASMINPFTGEEIHHGVRAGRVLGRTIGEWVNRGGGASQAGLERYARAYAGQFGKIVKMSQSLHELLEFQNTSGRRGSLLAKTHRSGPGGAQEATRKVLLLKHEAPQHRDEDTGLDPLDRKKS